MKKSAIRLFTHTIAVVVGLCIGWFGTAFELSGLFYESAQFEFPEQVLTEAHSPDKRFIARILYEKNTKNYFLSIEGREKDRLILTRKIVTDRICV